MFFTCLRFEATGTGPYTKTGVDENGRPIYKNDKYKSTIDGIDTRGEGSMILSFNDNYQKWTVSTNGNVITIFTSVILIDWCYERLKCIDSFYHFSGYNGRSYQYW